MKKVVVAEIGKSTLVLNAFGDIDTSSPRLLGQVVARSGLKSALTLLEKDIGALDGEHVEIHIVSSLDQNTLVQEILSHDELGDLNRFLKTTNTDKEEFGKKIVATAQAIMNLSRLFLEEVGEVLILDVGGGSTDIYLFRRDHLPRVTQGLGIYQDAKSIVTQIGEQDINVRYGLNWEELVKPIPKTTEEIALERELAAYTLQKAMLDFCRSNLSQAERFDHALDLTQLRWVIGTGGALNYLPGGLEMISEALSHCREVGFPEDGFPILLDRDNILASLGALKDQYRNGVWQLLLESLGVDS